MANSKLKINSHVLCIFVLFHLVAVESFGQDNKDVGLNKAVKNKYCIGLFGGLRTKFNYLDIIEAKTKEEYSEFNLLTYDDHASHSIGLLLRYERGKIHLSARLFRIYSNGIRLRIQPKEYEPIEYADTGSISTYRYAFDYHYPIMNNNQSSLLVFCGPSLVLSRWRGRTITWAVIPVKISELHKNIGFQAGLEYKYAVNKAITINYMVEYFGYYENFYKRGYGKQYISKLQYLSCINLICIMSVKIPKI